MGATRHGRGDPVGSRPSPTKDRACRELARSLLFPAAVANLERAHLRPASGPSSERGPGCETEGPRPDEPEAPRGASLATLARTSRRLLWVIALVAAVGWVLSQLRVVAIPAAVAFVGSALLVRPTDALSRRLRLPRGLAAALVLLCVAGTLGVTAMLLGTAVSSRLDGLGAELGQAVRQLGHWVVSLPLGVGHDEWSRALAEPLEAMPVDGGALGSRVMSGTRALATLVTQLALATVFAFFFAKDGRRLGRKVLAWLPEDRADRAEEAGLAAWRTMGAYLAGVALVGLANAGLFAVALWALGAPMVLPLALLTFLGSFVPFLGPTLAGGLAMLVALPAGGLQLSLLVLAATLVVQQIEGNLLQPLVMGHAVEVHPALVLAGVTVGFVVLGVAGAFLAVPLGAGAWCAWKTWHEQAKASGADGSGVTR